MGATGDAGAEGGVDVGGDDERLDAEDMVRDDGMVVRRRNGRRGNGNSPEPGDKNPDVRVGGGLDSSSEEVEKRDSRGADVGGALSGPNRKSEMAALGAGNGYACSGMAGRVG